MKKSNRKISMRWSLAKRGAGIGPKGGGLVWFHAMVDLGCVNVDDLERFVMRFRDELLQWNATVDAAAAAKKKPAKRARKAAAK